MIPNSYFQYRQAQLWSSTAIQHAVWFVLASKMQSQSYEEFTLKSSNERDESSVRCLKNEESASEKGLYKIKRSFENIGYNLGYLKAQCKENKE